MVGLGVDIGGSSVKAARVDLQSGRRLSERLSVPTPPGGEPGEVAAAVAGLCGQLSGREAGGREAGGGTLGVAFPGVVVGGRTLTAANVGCAWLGLDAAALLSAACGASVRVLNDADAAALAEARFGAARGQRGTVLVLTFGTGIGSGLLRGGCLVPNTELGHLRLERGQEAEAWAAARVKTAQGLSWPQWAARANRVIAELEALLWPDLLVIGGGLSGDSARWLPLLHSRAPLRPAALGGARRGRGDCGGGAVGRAGTLKTGLYILYSPGMQTQVGATEARARFSELLGRVLFRGERVVITRNGRECAALISLEELERLEAQADTVQADTVQARGR